MSEASMLRARIEGIPVHEVDDLPKFRIRLVKRGDLVLRIEVADTDAFVDAMERLTMGGIGGAVGEWTIDRVQEPARGA